jgi:dihydrofolate reductase
MLILIAAMAQNRVIGKDNKMPRHIPADFKHFKELTTGHDIVMGRKTFESIGRPLPHRKNIVLTRDTSWSAEGVESGLSPSAIIEQATKDEKDIYIIGGSQIYSYFFPHADKVELTIVKREVEGDAYFPIFEEDFEEVAREEHEEFDFVTYMRK